MHVPSAGLSSHHCTPSLCYRNISAFMLAWQPRVLVVAHAQFLTCPMPDIRQSTCTLSILVGCSIIYLSCHSSFQACHESAPPTLAWHMCCPSDLKAHSSDPSATIPTFNPALQSRILSLSLSATSQPVMRLLALCTRWARTLAVLGFIGRR